VRLWDARSGQPLGQPLQGHTTTVTSVVFSPDGQRLAEASYDKTIHLREARSGKPLGPPLQGHTSVVTSVAFSPDGQRLASASEDRTVRLWDARSGQPLGQPLQGHTGNVLSVAFSPDSQRLASASEDKTVRLWDAHSGQALGKPLQGHTDRVTSVVFSPGGQRLASGSWDKTVRLWDARSGQPLGQPLHGHTAWVTSVAFSPDGQRLASASGDDTVRLWDARSGQPLGQPLQGHTWDVIIAAFSTDGTTLWSFDDSMIVKAWDIRTGKEVPNPGGPPLLSWDPRHPSKPLLALPDGKNILLIDLSPPDADELAFREGKAAFDPLWHDEQAAAAEKKEQWFAAAFHRALLTQVLPWRGNALLKLDAACRKLGDDDAGLAACNRMLQEDPALAPVYLERAAIRLRKKDARGTWADLVRGLSAAVRDHPDWPEFAGVQAGQGSEAAKREDWPQAVHHYTLAAAWQPHDPWHLHRLAWGCLAAGDEEGYRSTCRRLHARFGNIEGKRDVQDAANRVFAIVNAACLLPDSGVDPDVLATLGTYAVAADATDPNYRSLYGAALYRAGKYSEAVKQLEEAIRLQGGDGSNWKNLFLAMAYHRVDEAAKARERFARARLPENAGWEPRLLYRKLHEEAATLLNAASPGR
jgi:tetratricopeptide (TPR) repeat protein